MTGPRRFTLDELTIRVGTYFNPQTEVLIVVDDSAEVDHQLFDGDEFESTEWVLVAEELPLDEHKRDELIESFRASYHPGARGDDDGDGDGDHDDLDDEDDVDADDLDELEVE
jgi:hypothetical protein